VALKDLSAGFPPSEDVYERLTIERAFASGRLAIPPGGGDAEGPRLNRDISEQCLARVPAAVGRPAVL
jgi:hypothetical protein